MFVLLTAEEVEDRLDEIASEGPEYDSLRFLRDVYYLHAEGIIEIENGRCYAIEG